jgi:hypothetical protein
MFHQISYNNMFKSLADDTAKINNGDAGAE